MVYLLAAFVILEIISLKMAAGIYLGWFVFVGIPLFIAHVASKTKDGQ